MITQEKASAFADEWIQGWNNHDIEAVLAHYSEDFAIDTPIAAKVVAGCDGHLSGKAAIRAYWQKALGMIPDLRFELIDVLSGTNSITIYYRNAATDRRSAEVLFFGADGLVDKAVVNYSQEAAV